MNLKLLTLLFGMALVTNVFSQTKEPALTVQLLANDKIVDVNIEQETFIKSLGNIVDYCKSNFSSISEKQKIGILIIVHKTGNPTYECHSNPRIDPQWQGKILKELGDIPIENTRLVDFPVFISINSKNDEATTDFADYEDPIKKQYSEYENGDLQTKLKLLKEYAITQVLPVLSSYQVIVDDTFEGVKTFGKLIQSTDFTQPQDVNELTSANGNYWRATSEMSIGNQLIPLTKISALVSQGEIDYAQKFIEIINMFSDPETITNHYLNEISYRVKLFNQELNKRD